MKKWWEKSASFKDKAWVRICDSIAAEIRVHRERERITHERYLAFLKEIGLSELQAVRKELVGR